MPACDNKVASTLRTAGSSSTINTGAITETGEGGWAQGVRMSMEA